MGLKTGLIGNDDSLVEGLAITMVDDTGAHASVLVNARGASGSGVTTPDLDLAAGTPADMSFPKLTDGPPTMAMAHGGPVKLSR
jgi:hypothetical protein